MRLPVLQCIDLNGKWRLNDASGEFRLEGNVPGCVHTDLLQAGLIEDPWYRDNEKDVHWVCQRDWFYQREFDVSAEFLSCEHQVLRCEGLDTLCTVEVNGVTLMKTDNMFHPWEVAVGSHLKVGKNSIKLIFASPIPYMKQRDAKLRLPSWNIYHEDFFGKSYLRKMACAFGWDWGLMAPGAGAWQPVKLLGFNSRWKHLHISQLHVEGRVEIEVNGISDGSKKARYTLLKEGLQVASVESTTGAAILTVPAPELWWPNGMGAQPLYTLTAELLDDHGTVIDKLERKIGLRTIELRREPDRFGESFRFVVNGREVFIKGGNWIPCDIWPSRVEKATYTHLLQSTADSNMNMIRVWGGGIYEQEGFYDLCDQLGLLVWQDFMFACSTYPTFDPAFMKSVANEATYQVQRLHHRACLALWCGNNELEQGLVKWTSDGWDGKAMPADDYLRLFDDLLPKIVTAHDGSTTYWPSSGHTPGENRKNCHDSRRGDAHSWSVWFGGEPIEGQRNWVYRFMSEFGFQSFPELKSVEKFTAPEDRNLVNWIMDYHQRSGPGNRTIFNYLLQWFQPAGDFENTLWMTQLIQGICIQVAAEHARRIQGRMDGLMYWQINDLWPGATWSSIDVYGRWKALHFLAKRFFAPVLVSLLENNDEGTVEIHVSNHRPEAFKGVVKWEITDAAGEVLMNGSCAAEVASQCNEKLTTLDLQDLRNRKGNIRLPLELLGHSAIPMLGDRDTLIWAFCEEDGVEVSRNLAYFTKPKYWSLAEPVITTQAIDKDGYIEVTFNSDTCAPWTRITLKDSDALPSDNFFHLSPNHPVTITFNSPGLTANQVLRQLTITPLCKMGE